jgi:two-component system chemotaxis response regulator CheY
MGGRFAGGSIRTVLLIYPQAMARILVVEDSAAMRAYIRAALESAPRTGPLEKDVEVVEAASGFDALRLLPRGPYDLVITDINMPDINGLELIQFIRKSDRHRSTAVLIVSTQSSEKDRARGLQLGADDYLAKPLNAEALAKTVDRLLAGRPAPST